MQSFLSSPSLEQHPSALPKSSAASQAVMWKGYWQELSLGCFVEQNPQSSVLNIDLDPLKARLEFKRRCNVGYDAVPLKGLSQHDQMRAERWRECEN